MMGDLDQKVEGVSGKIENKGVQYIPVCPRGLPRCYGELCKQKNNCSNYQGRKN